MEFQESLTQSVLKAFHQAPCTCYRNHQIWDGWFPLYISGHGKIIGSSQTWKWQLKVLFCSSISPVIVTDFIIKLLLDFRVLLKVLIRCHCADLFLHTQTRYRSEWTRCIKYDKQMQKFQEKRSNLRSTKEFPHLHFPEFSNFLLDPFWLLQRRFLSLLQFNNLQVTYI